jgi:hypothetical protein
MLEAKVKQLEKQACEDCRYNKSLIARLVPLLRKEAAEKEATEHSMERVIFIMSYFYFE